MSLTKKDLQDIGKLITDVTSVLNADLERRMGDRFDKKLLSFKEEIKDDIYRFKDEILGEIQNLRDDMQVTKGYGDRIENHEERITSLEQPVVH